ncbi:MAG: aldehyde:ferredoxin oxidoreductase, partial [Oscillospiraceae bacterium]|nr:aldehyde:ferredoxin oxidoreductase [Oscillospiraceae bacterium]
PFTALYPVMTKAVAVFISPLTGEYGESHAGGRFGMAMFNCGYDAIVITGGSRKPTFLDIDNNNVAFKDARVIWKTGRDIVAKVVRGRETASGKRTIVHIGRSGENLVSFANVTVDKYRHFGRIGLGALFGSKHLKAITLMGDRSVPVIKYKEYLKTFREILHKCTSTDLMTKYHDVGTPINVAPLNTMNALPSYNLQRSSVDYVDEVSGERFANDFLVRKVSCAGCPVGCVHIGQFRRAFAEHGHEYEVVSVAYDYELIFALGTFLGVSHPANILELIEEVEIEGMDAMSAGVCLGWATEAYSKGVITDMETIVPLEFGNWENYKQAIIYLGSAKNEFYINLGKGVRHASSVYGGGDYAMHVAGNEMAGYHTGYGSLVGATVAARHSHLCNAGYSIDQSMTDFNADEMVDWLFTEELERNVTNSLVMCLFARKIYDNDTIISAFDAIDVKVTKEDLERSSKLIYQTKLRIKKALGFDLSDVKLPKRNFETPSFHGVLDEETTYNMIEKYKAKAEALLREVI